MSNIKHFVSRFSTKKDALTCIDILAEETGDAKWTEFRKLVYNFSDSSMAKQVMDLFNDIMGTRYQNVSKIESVIRQIPKATLKQFESVIRHKQETWGNDPKMKEYIRPATLFGSKNKFETYLDDATQYWIEQLKKDGI